MSSLRRPYGKRRVEYESDTISRNLTPSSSLSWNIPECLLSTKRTKKQAELFHQKVEQQLGKKFLCDSGLSSPRNQVGVGRPSRRPRGALSAPAQHSKRQWAVQILNSTLCMFSLVTELPTLPACQITHCGIKHEVKCKMKEKKQTNS